ncbi:MerR family DNA-binding transcriptional regulator [Acidothermaceae bacterium B102]|nr:MerR family DNA-binding transcriptional regulator [Acidothermaceae bacterium B102]
MGAMEDSLLGIGAMAQASGLTVSALRFYDGAGVLVPASVDPWNGYRRYSQEQVDDARLVARLRRVGMAVPDLRLVLGWRQDAVEALAVLDRHLSRLEHGLVDAQRELSMVRTLIDQKENTVPTSISIQIDAGELAAALHAVRFAVGSDPELPALSGVLLELEEELTLVATDRYRLAVATVPVTGATARVQALVPVSLIDALLPLLAGQSGDVLVVVDDAVSFTVGGSTLRGEPVDLPYPDYRRLTDLPAGRRVTVDAAGLRTSVLASTARTMVREQDGVPYDVVELLFGDAGVSVVGAESSTGTGIGVNREFLLEALVAGGEGQLVLELDGPIAPLAIRPVARESFSLLMPTRLG